MRRANGGGGTTGGNTEPMTFRRQFGTGNAGATGEAVVPNMPPIDHDSHMPVGPISASAAGPPPPPPGAVAHLDKALAAAVEKINAAAARGPQTPTDEPRRRRSRSRSRSRGRSSSSRKKSSKKKRSRSRSRSRSRDRRRRSRRSRDRSRSRSPPRRRNRLSEAVKKEEDAPPPTLVQVPGLEPGVQPVPIKEEPDQPPLGGDQSLLNAARRKRRSRWGGENEKSFVPGLPTMLPSGLTEEQQTAYLLQLKIEDHSRKLRTGDLGINPDPSKRSPSPEPVYDLHGKRLNTREYRTKIKLEKDRHEAVQDMMKLNPMYRAPADYRPPIIRLHEKVFIPQDEHPQVNFVGLIIGPRGNTLKTLERETGAKIIIRGKGSVKEGKLAIAYQNSLPGAEEDLHAYVTAVNEKCIKDACQKIRDIIDSALAIPDGQNELRQLQLRELALLNGTLRPEDLLSGNRCSNCGAADHKSWECSEAENVTGSTICMRCGGAGHIARDCKGEEGGAALDEEYTALMAELGEGGGGGGLGRGGGMGIRGRGSPFFRGGMGRGLQYGKPNFEGGADAVSSIKEELSKIKSEDGGPTVVRINLASRPRPQPLMSIDMAPPPGAPPPMPPWGWPPMPPGMPSMMPPPPGMPPMPPSDPSTGMPMAFPPWPPAHTAPVEMPAPVPPPPAHEDGGDNGLDLGSLLMPPAPPPPPPE